MENIQSALQNDGKLFLSESNTKNCEISSDEDVKSNLLALESIPEEILIEVFSFLPFGDLLNATLVSKHFNSIISDSSKLLNKIKFNYDFWDDKTNWKGSRKYPNVKIECGKTKKLFLLEFDKASVKVLDLYLCSISLHELRKFLLEFVNLEEFRTHITDFDELKDFEILSLPKRNLRELKFSSMDCKVVNKLMILFSNEHIKKLIMENFVNFSENPNIVTFLMNQNILEHLSINSDDFKQLDDVKFKLKSFKVQSIDEIEINYLGKFLQNHQDSLIELKIYGINDETAEVLNKFTKLKKLTVNNGGISKILKSSTVENLTLYECKCEGSFPFVKELRLYKRNIKIIEDMKCLHKLTIDRIKVDEISIPSVKVLILYNIRCETRPFKFETSNLDELEIINLLNSQQWIIEYLDRDETQLKKLKFEFSIFSPELVAAIKRNCPKIKCFETKRCREESQEFKSGVESDYSTFKEIFLK